MAPKPTLTCTPAARVPWLDGKLDDEVWQQPQFARLTSAQGDDDEWPAEILVAADQQFLFLAVRCRKAAGAEYPPATGTRTRDADLTNADRVEAADRPGSGLRELLSARHRPSRLDRRVVLGRQTLEPPLVRRGGRETNKVGRRKQPSPGVELTDASRPSGDTWAMSVYRVVPGVGFQSWTPMASATTVLPDGFGYLRFP